MDILKLESLEDLLKGHFNGRLLSHKVEKLTAAGENYLSLMLKVDLKYLTNGFKRKEETLHLVAKISSSEFLEFGPMNPEVLFKKEIKWYSEVVPLLRGFAKIYDLEAFIDIYPKYYNGRIPKNQEFGVLLLENVGEEYKCHDRSVGFDYETSKLVLNNLARFHSTSIALKLKKPELFKEKISPVVNMVPLRQPTTDTQNRTQNGAPTSFEDVIRNVLAESHDHSHYIPRVEEALRQADIANKPREVSGPWTTVTHNDFWTNNIMVKKQNNKPTNIKIVDFQVTEYGSVAADLMFFLLTSVKLSILQTQLLDELIKYYYDQLILDLKQFKLRTEYFRYIDYLKELETETRKRQFGHAAIMMNFIYGKKSSETTEAHETRFQEFFMIMSNIPKAHQERILAVTDVCAKRNWI